MMACLPLSCTMRHKSQLRWSRYKVPAWKIALSQPAVKIAECNEVVAKREEIPVIADKLVHSNDGR